MRRWIVLAAALTVGCNGGSKAPEEDGALDAASDVAFEAAVLPDLFATPDAPLPPPPNPSASVCTSASWCWDHPLPQGMTLRAAWAGASGLLYLVGDGGAILTYDGSSKTWSSLAAGTTADLVDICGDGQGALYVPVYLNNYGRVRRHDSSGWSQVYQVPWKYGRLYAVAAAAGKVYAAGTGNARGRIVRYDGSAWATVHTSPGSETYNAIWAGPQGGVVAVANSGLISQFDGTSWKDVKSGTTYQLKAVWGADEANVFVVGSGGTALRYDGSSWKPMATASNADLQGVWGSSATEVFAVGQVRVAGGGPYSYVVFARSGDTWVKKQMGTAVSSSSYSSSYLTTVGGTPGGEVIAAGVNGLLLQRGSAGWSRISTRVTTATLRDIWALDASTVFAVGDTGRVLERVGDQWREHQLSVPFSARGIWGSSASDLYAVGSSGSIFHYDGSTWSAQTSGTSTGLWDVWGSGAKDIFVVGDNGIILHGDGATWTPMASGAGDSLRGIWGSSSSDVYAVGGSRTILHYDGKEWSVEGGTATQPQLYGVWGSAAGDVYAVGRDTDKDAEIILHYDGTGWTTAYTGAQSSYLYGVGGSGAQDVFAVGSTGTILRYDGTAWAAQASGVARALYAVWGTATEAFAVGETGMVLRRKP